LLWLILDPPTGRRKSCSAIRTSVQRWRSKFNGWHKKGSFYRTEHYQSPNFAKCSNSLL